LRDWGITCTVEEPRKSGATLLRMVPAPHSKERSLA
jgi:hypothetical protein